MPTLHDCLCPRSTYRYDFFNDLTRYGGNRDGNATPYGLKESPREPADLFTASMSMSSICSEDGAPGNSASTRARDESYGDDNTFCVAECVLVAAHVELCGSACSVDWVGG